jgi:hypothetical protein
LRLAAVLVAVMLAAALVGPTPRFELSPGEAAIRSALLAGTGVVDLPAGVTEVSSEIEIPRDAHDLEIRGAVSGSTVRAAAHFRGRAIFRLERASRIRFARFTVDGSRGELERRGGLPGFSTPFALFTTGNGILAIRASGLRVENVRFVNIAGFAILVSRSREVEIDRVEVEDSGSRTLAGRNNTTGGILIEEGTSGFSVTHCRFRNVRGNAVWTHSIFSAPQNSDGRIAGNHFRRIGRDAIQVGHGKRVRVEENSGSEIGYPIDDVDIEQGATPVALDTAGNTDECVYLRNRFEEVNGKCIDLDGFHDGAVRDNVCVNRLGADAYPFGNIAIALNNNNPDMLSERIEIVNNEFEGTLYSGMFIIGSQHRVAGNRLRRTNLAHCNESAAKFGCNYAPEQPDLLRSGIYLATGGARPDMARDNVIEENEISGFGMSVHCISAAPGVSLAANRIARNICRDE